MENLESSQQKLGKLPHPSNFCLTLFFIDAESSR
uniref:Uncharacterized protein n=1 Tax=Siphoviridae sp. ctmpG14 TaxID=2825654 RepID=A0A8S5PCP9_9CAUD|nr:MAG TPA: hypothetical protein [Siphoviridae sp. ctmpG14]